MGGRIRQRFTHTKKEAWLFIKARAYKKKILENSILVQYFKIMYFRQCACVHFRQRIRLKSGYLNLELNPTHCHQCIIINIEMVCIFTSFVNIHSDELTSDHLKNNSPSFGVAATKN
ncbi:hypothetical protein HZS_3111 [Henneguya salminicola]|nr:hypothetical protein HZS_3111 [Henneguya salminicola]